MIKWPALSDCYAVWVYAHPEFKSRASATGLHQLGRESHSVGTRDSCGHPCGVPTRQAASAYIRSLVFFSRELSLGFDPISWQPLS